MRSNRSTELRQNMGSKYRIKILPSAEEELDGIITYLETFGEQAARNFMGRYREQLELLASGVIDYGLSHLPELSNLGYHACSVNRYVLLYYREGDCVVIAHIFHQRQDYAHLI